MHVRRSRAAVAAIVLCLAGLTACDPPPPPVVLTVTSNGDAADTAPGDGVCRAPTSFPGIFTCTLRAAVQEASASHVDRIVSPSWRIPLTTPLTIDPVADTLAIVPSGAGRITIAGPAVTGDTFIAITGGTVALRSVAVTGSAAAAAITVFEEGSMVLVDGQVTDNDGSGVVVAGNALIASTSVRGNGHNGIFLAAGSTGTILRSSVTGNAAPGIYVRSLATTTIEATTTSGNSRGLQLTSSVRLRGSTIADGTFPSGAGTIAAEGSIVVGPCTGPVQSLGYNALGTGCGTVGATDVAATAAVLDPLTDDPLPYRPINDAGAALRNHIPVGSGPCTTGVLDQLGRVRTADGSCSVGAHEAIGALGTLRVDTAADGADAAPGDGVCAAEGGACTFRAALQEADAASGGSAPQVVIQDGIDPVLSAAGGRLPADHVTISGGGATVDLGGGPGLAHCSGDTVIEDLTLTGAVNTSSVGAIAAECALPTDAVTGRVELRRSTISGNTGTGISSDGAELLVVDSVVADNTWWGIGAGADTVTVRGSTLSGNGSYAIVGDDSNTIEVVVEDSTIDGNGGGISSSDVVLRSSSVTDNEGAGVDSFYPDVTIDRSLVAGNGRGIDAQEPGTVTVTDSTVSGNDTGAQTRWGAGLVAQRTTFADNTTALAGSADSFSLAGTVLAGGSGPACSTGATSAGWNVVDDTSCGLTGTGDQQGADPLLGPLSDNGGPTLTHVPGAGSPAIDAVPATTADLCAGAPADQRGIERPQGPACDAGAVEAIVLPDGDFVVTSPDDESDADPGDGTCATSGGGCSLRAALEEAATVPAGTIPVVAIAPGVHPVLDPSRYGIPVGEVTIDGNGATIDVGGGELGFRYCEGAFTVEDLTITGAVEGDTWGVIDVECDGTGPTDVVTLHGVTISGNGGPAITGTGPEPTVGLVVTDSTISDNRYGIQEGFGSMTIERTTLSGNEHSAISGGSFSGLITVVDSTVEDNGGGVFNDDGGIVVRRSSITGNDGFGVATEYSSATVEQSLIAGNGTGVGTYDGGVTVLDSTLSGNGTGAITDLAGTITVRRSTVAGNGSTFRGIDGTFRVAGSILVPGTQPTCEPGLVATSLGWNVAADTSCGLAGTGDVQGVDPLLGPLADNGGPTATHLPANGSPSIDVIPAGTADLCTGSLVDQRGVTRPQGAACDRGAVEQ